MSYIAAFGMLMIFFMACIVLLRLVTLDNKSFGSTLRVMSNVSAPTSTFMLTPLKMHVSTVLATPGVTSGATPGATVIATPGATPGATSRETVLATPGAIPVTKPVTKYVSIYALLQSWLMPQLLKPSFKKNNTTKRQYITSKNLRGSNIVCNENSEKLKSYNISFPAENDEEIIIAQVKNLLPQIYDKGYLKVRVCHSNCVTTSSEFKFNLISIFPKLELSIENFFNKFESIGNTYEVQFCKP
jgi:hypothetical protein